MCSSSPQALPDSFFGRERGDGVWLRAASDCAWARARAQAACPSAVVSADRLLAAADSAGLMPRWLGLRLVDADASVPNVLRHDRGHPAFHQSAERMRHPLWYALRNQGQRRLQVSVRLHGRRSGRGRRAAVGARAAR